MLPGTHSFSAVSDHRFLLPGVCHTVYCSPGLHYHRSLFRSIIAPHSVSCTLAGCEQAIARGRPPSRWHAARYNTKRFYTLVTTLTPTPYAVIRPHLEHDNVMATCSRQRGTPSDAVRRAKGIRKSCSAPPRQAMKRKRMYEQQMDQLLGPEAAQLVPLPRMCNFCACRATPL